MVNSETTANGSTKSYGRTWPDVAVVRCGGSLPACHSEVENGEFVVVWANLVSGTPNTVEILSRAFSKTGVAKGSGPTQLNNDAIEQLTPAVGILPDVAVNDQGEAIAVWEYIDDSTNPDHTALRYCEFNPFLDTPSYCSTDVAVADPQTSGEGQTRPSVDYTSDQDIVIAWTEWPMNNQVESQTSSWFWRKFASGSGDGPFHVDWDDTTPDEGHHRPVVRFIDDDADHLAMAWTFDETSSDGDILGRQVCMDTNGDPDTSGPGEATLNTSTAGDQRRPAFDYGYVSQITNTRVFLTWESLDDGASTTDWDVFARAWDPDSGCS